MKTFICECCGKKFRKTNTDEESLLDSQLLFGDVPEDELAGICDDCYQQIVPLVKN